MKKSLIAMFTVCCLILSSAVPVTAEILQEQDMVIKVTETITSTVKAEDVAKFKEDGYTETEIENLIRERVIEHAKNNGIPLEKEEIEVSAEMMRDTAWPPGSRTKTISDSTYGDVDAAIPALGICYIRIRYNYNCTVWSHDLYQVSGCVVNSGSQVTDSTLYGTSLGSWKHRSGTITYANDQNVGTCLKVVANGDMTYVAEVGASVTTTAEMSFLYYHKIDIEGELG